MTPRPEEPPATNLESPGLKEEVTLLTKNAAAYLAIRSELAALEGSEAASFIKKRVTSLMIGAALAIFAYLLFLAAAVSFFGAFLASYLDKSLTAWSAAALIIGSLHVVIALIFFLKARKKPASPLFELTRSEWKKDQQWIRKQTNSTS